MVVPNLTLNSGKTMPQIGFGTWLAAPGVVQTSVEAAVKAGFRHIDCAWIYGNEPEVGNAFKNIFSSGIKREELFITSKLWNTFHKPKDVLPAIKSSLDNLGLDYLDLYLIHWPMGYENGGDKSVTFPKDANAKIVHCASDFLDTWREMENAVDAGLVKSIGISNFNQEQIQRIVDNCRIKPAVQQIECHPYNNQHKMKAYCDSVGIKITAYSPFGNPGRPWAGTAKDGANNDQVSLLKHDVITKIGEKYSKGAGHVLLRYQLDRGIICLTKSVKAERIQSNFDVFGFKLDKDDIAAIDALNLNLRILPLSWDGLCNHKDYPFKSELNDKSVY